MLKSRFKFEFFSRFRQELISGVILQDLVGITRHFEKFGWKSQTRT